MSSKNKIVVMYVLLPLLVLSFALPAFNLTTSNNTPIESNIINLASVGLMMPDTSDDIYEVHLGAKAAFDTYNYWYGDDETVSAYSRLNNYATTSRFLSDIKYRDRVQVVSHGSMTSYGPRVELYGSNYISAYNYATWDTSYGKCELVLLAACYSMGTGGAGDLRLARAIKDRTPVKMVVGFNGQAELFATAFLVMNFWYQQLAGYRYNNNVGGYPAATSVSRSIWFLDSFLDDAYFTINIAVSIILGYFIGPMAFTSRSVMSRILYTIFKGTITEYLFNLWTANIRSTMNAFTYLNDGEFVGSLTVIGSGGGGGSGPIDTID